MNNLKNNVIILASVLVATGVFPLLSSSSLTTNPEDIIESYEGNNAKYVDEVNSRDKDDIHKSCEESFLPQSEGGSILKNF